MIIAVQVRYSVEAGVLLLGLCVLIGPLLAERGRVPGLIGLVGAGAVLGPHVLAWLQPGGFVATLGAAGLLYLMFVAGVELDLKAFVANRNAAIAFGVLTFVIPFGLSFAIGHFYLDLGVSATALVGAMWASHTVVAYPEVKAAGIDRHRVIGVSLAATVITDVAALVVLAVAASSTALVDAPEVADELARGTLETSTTLPLWVGGILLIVVCFGIIPRATRWLFAHLLFERTQRFVWALVAMAGGAVAGLLGGIEGLVGAFLAGIGMNTSVPARSELMERIEFIGSALLVPAFLIAVGLSIDPVALVDPSTLGLAAVFIAIVLAGKSLAALAAGSLYSFARVEMALMTTLTIGQAAATLAIAQVGVDTGLFDDQIRNAAIVTVVVTVIVASIGTRLAARRVATPEPDFRSIGDQVLVLAPPVDVPLTPYASLASALVERDGGLVTAAGIRSIRSSLVADERSAIATRLRELDRALVRLGHDTEPIQRVAASLPAGVAHVADELDATIVIVPVAHHRLLQSTRDAELIRIAGATDTPVAAMAIGDTPIGRVVLLTHPDGADDANAPIAVELARRIAAARGGSLWIAPEPEAQQAAFAALATRRLRRDTRSGRLELRDGDLVIASAAALRADGAIDPRVVVRHLTFVIVVGHRRSPHAPGHPLLGAVTTTSPHDPTSVVGS